MGQHQSGFVAGFTDGSVQVLSKNIDDETLRNSFHRSDGNVTDIYEFRLDNSRRRGRYGSVRYAPEVRATAVEERAVDDHGHGDHDHDHAHEAEAVKEEAVPVPDDAPRDLPAVEAPRFSPRFPEPPAPEARDGASVEGTMSLDGEPLAGAVIKYYAEGDRRPTAVGNTQDDGTFRLRTATGEPLKPGRYRVSVAKFSAPTADARDAEAALVKLATPKSYAAPATSPLQVEVQGGNNVMDIDLAGE